MDGVGVLTAGRDLLSHPGGQGGWRAWTARSLAAAGPATAWVVTAWVVTGCAVQPRLRAAAVVETGGGPVVLVDGVVVLETTVVDTDVVVTPGVVTTVVVVAPGRVVVVAPTGLMVVEVTFVDVAADRYAATLVGGGWKSSSSRSAVASDM